MGSRNLDQVYDVGDQLAHQNSPFLLLFKALDKDYQVGCNHADIFTQIIDFYLSKRLSVFTRKTCICE